MTETLRTMGSAVLSGGLSTLLGIIPLAFSTSQVMRTVFITFFAMIALGVTHGLVLLPVVLSVVGPETTVSSNEAPKKSLSTAEVLDEEAEGQQEDLEAIELPQLEEAREKGIESTAEDKASDQPYLRVVGIVGN